MLSERQLQMRRTGIGASECAAVAGYHPFLTAFDVFNAKVFGTVPDENAAMRAGSFLENGVARMYTDDTGVKLHKAPTRRHPKHRWMLATVDRYAVVDGERRWLVEIKCPGSRYRYNADLGERELVWGYSPDEIPAYIACQAQWQMEVCGFDRCDVVALFLNSRELAIYPQERNQRVIDALITINGRFWWNNVSQGVPPEIDHSSGAAEYLRQVYPQDTRPMLDEPPAGAHRIAWEYAMALRDERDVQERKKLFGNKLRALVGDAAGFEAPWGKVMWKSNERGSINYRSLADDLRSRLQQLSDARSPLDPEQIRSIVGDLHEVTEAHRMEPKRVLRVRYTDDLRDQPVPTATCPGCGAEVEDRDGYGVLAHTKPDGCGYCSHLSRDGGVCVVCGDREAPHLSLVADVDDDNQTTDDGPTAA